jgi:hypothetical protein
MTHDNPIENNSADSSSYFADVVRIATDRFLEGLETGKVCSAKEYFEDEGSEPLWHEEFDGVPDPYRTCNAMILIEQSGDRQIQEELLDTSKRIEEALKCLISYQRDAESLEFPMTRLIFASPGPLSHLVDQLVHRASMIECIKRGYSVQKIAVKLFKNHDLSDVENVIDHLENDFDGHHANDDD